MTSKPHILTPYSSFHSLISFVFLSPDSPSPYPSPRPCAETEGSSSPGLDVVFRRLVDLADVVDSGCAGQVRVSLFCCDCSRYRYYLPCKLLSLLLAQHVHVTLVNYLVI